MGGDPFVILHAECLPLQVVKPQQLVASELEMAGDSQFVPAAAAKEAAVTVQPAAEERSADAAEAAMVAGPALAVESPKPTKQWGMAALKGLLRSPPRVDKSAEKLAPEPAQVSKTTRTYTLRCFE